MNKPLVFRIVSIFLTAICILSIISCAYIARAYRYYRKHQTHFSGDLLIKEDPLIGYVQRPGVKLFHTEAPRLSIFTNDRGFRSVAPGMKAASTVDVLGIGCSFTWGHGVTAEKTYLELLAQQPKRRDLKMANAALASYGMTASVLSAQKNKDLKPKIIVYGFIEDSIRRSYAPCAPCLSPLCRSVSFVEVAPNGQPKLNPPLFATNEYYDYFQDMMVDHPFGWRDIYWTVRRDVLALQGRDSSHIIRRYAPKDIPLARQVVTRYLLEYLIRICRDIKAKLIVVYIPFPADMSPPPQELLSALQPYSRDTDVSFLDMTGPFENYILKHGEDSLRVGGMDAHPNEAGHQLIADSLSPLIDHWLEPGSASAN